MKIISHGAIVEGGDGCAAARSVWSDAGGSIKEAAGVIHVAQGNTPTVAEAKVRGTAVQMDDATRLQPAQAGSLN